MCFNMPFPFSTRVAFAEECAWGNPLFSLLYPCSQ